MTPWESVDGLSRPCARQHRVHTRVRRLAIGCVACTQPMLDLL